MIENEYLELAYECNGLNDFASKQRGDLVQRFSWAIPTEEALKVLVKYSPIVEIGAGSGYWAYLANDRGANVKPYDKYPGDRNKYKHFETWTKVYRGNENVLKKLDRNVNLFLCWPPYQESMAEECLHNFNGDYLIYVGEGKGGCTGTDQFHIRLYNDWKIVECISIPQWYGLHDTFYIYKRKTAETIIGRKLNLDE